MPVSTPPTLVHKPPQLRPRGSCPHGDDDVRSTPPRISVRTRIAGTRGGRAGGLSAPMATAMGGAGGHCGASSVAALFWSPSGRSCLARAPPSRSSCASARAWPQAWGAGGRRGGVRWPRIPCCGGSSQRRSSCRPSPDTSGTMWGASRGNSMHFLPGSARCRTARAARLRPARACSGRPRGSFLG